MSGADGASGAQPSVTLLGLTGNIATGKSTVAAILRELGAIVLDADQIAREVIAPGTEGLAEVVRAFGREVLRPDGSLDRRAMAARVFRDPAQLRRLEAIIHPRVRQRLEAAIAAAPPGSVLVLEVIRLFEASYAARCRQVWVTDCPREMQIARLMASRGMSREEATLRVDAQPPQSEKRARADVVIDTSGDLENTRRQVLTAWRRLTEM